MRSASKPWNAFQDQKLELRLIVIGGHAPFVVVIAEVELIAFEGPEAALRGGGHRPIYRICARAL
jgi:hypothetical protein